MPEGRGNPCRAVWLAVAMFVVGIDSARPQGFIAEPALPLAGNAAPTEEAYVPTIDRPPAWDRPAVSRGADDRPTLEGSWNHGMRLSSPDSAFNGMTLGLNWLLTPNARVYFNYDCTFRMFESYSGGDGDGVIHGLGTRMAFDF